MVITAILQAPPNLFVDVENEHRKTFRQKVYFIVATADQKGNCGINPVSLIDGKFYVGGKNIAFDLEQQKFCSRCGL